METKSPFDFSIRSAPETWREAAVDAPEGDPDPIRRKRVVGELPIRYEIDAVTASIAAFAISIVTGAGWYLLEVQNGAASPWIALALGAVIAIAVRLRRSRPRDRRCG